MTIVPITSSVQTPSTTLSTSKKLDSSKSLVKTEEKRPRELWREACLYSTPLPTVLITLVEKYAFSNVLDIMNIYNEAIGTYAYIPKGRGSDLTAEQRNDRIRKEENEVVSRLIREFKNGQSFQLKQKDCTQFKPIAFISTFPHTKKASVGTDLVGVSFFKGSRDSMENSYVFQQLTVTIEGTKHIIPLYGVFDGFCGIQAAAFARDNLGPILTQELMTFNRQGWSLVGIWNALKISCVHLHNAFLERNPNVGNQGSMMVFAIKCNGQLWIANVGNSRAILNDNGECIALTWDAKPDDPRIRKGIENRGGKVTRFGGAHITGPKETLRLPMGRFIGCPAMEGANNMRPKITMIPLNYIAPGSELALGCCGIFDVASSLQINDVIHKNSHLHPEQIAQLIVYLAHRAGSTNNMTMMVVRF